MTQQQRTTRQQAPAPADISGAAGVPPADVAAPPVDPRVPGTAERLRRRTPGGGYEVPDTELVLAIRAWKARGEMAVVRDLCEVLIARCQPEFVRRAWGLRHNRQLMEDAIGGMVEQVLREVQDPREDFLTKNFIHYLHCVGADNFGRVLRQEGLSYRRDAEGRPAGRPQHVPRALIDRIEPAAEEQSEGGGGVRDVPAAHDAVEALQGALEAQRILSFLPDALDRQIVALRVYEQLRWDDIARICGKTERTMRLRYEKARVTLRERLAAEQTAARG